MPAPEPLARRIASVRDGGSPSAGHQPPEQSLARGIASVRRRARLAIGAKGAACLIAAVGGLALLVSLADRGLHFNNPSLRAGLLAGLIATGLAVAWRYLVRPLIFPLSDTAIAMRIERRFPHFEESLASSVQFLHDGRDRNAGSPELQQRVISETLERAAGVDFRDVVRFAPALPAIVAAACIIVAAAVLAALWPVDAAIALRRLFVPYAAPAWPRQNNLRLFTVDFRPIDPATETMFTVIHGQKLDLLIDDRSGRLPDDVSLEYSLPAEPKLKESLRHVTLHDREGKARDVCPVSLPAERGPVTFRAIGGDDDTMPELEMRVVFPPQIESLQLHLKPPGYTNRPVQSLLPGDGRIRGVVGTVVSFRARSSKPLALASLLVKGKPAGTTSIAKGEDARGFQGTFSLVEPGNYAYSFRLKDAEGIEGGDFPRYEIEALPDGVPEVAIDEPASDATVTADAQIPVTVSAKDDWGLREMRLRFHIGDNAEAAHTSVVPLAADLPRPQHHRVAIRWRLGDLAVSEGMRIVFHAEAADWFDMGPSSSPSTQRSVPGPAISARAVPGRPGGPAHVGHSASRTLTVVSAKQKEAEIVSRQADVLRLLERAEQSQSRTRNQAGELGVQLDKAGRLNPSDVDVLKRIQTDQRQVNLVLADPADGAASAVRGLLDELLQNRVASPQTQERLERFNRELSELRGSHLPAIDNQITRAVKTAELQSSKQLPVPEAAREQAKALTAARREQSIVLESLRNMLGELSQWRNRQAVNDGLRDLVESQEKLNRETADLSRSTLARPLSDLGKQEQADLARLAERQTRLAEQTEQIRQRLREAATKTDSSERDSAGDAAATLKSIERVDPESRMREIGGQLAQNNIGQAMARQQQLLDELRKLDVTLTQPPERDLQSFVKKLGETEQKIIALRNDQETLRKRTRAHADQGKPPKERGQELEALRKEQDRLREAADETARELRRLGTETPTERMQQAGSHMSQAEDGLDRGSSASAQSQQKQALDELDRARAALARDKKRAARRLAEESTVRVADELAGLAARQKTVIDETKRLNGEHTLQSRWTRGQLRSLQTVARNEGQLREETTRIADRLADAEVYAWALRQGAERMHAAAERLSGQQTDAQTQRLETEAWSRLGDLAQALKIEPAAIAGNENDAEPQETGRQGGSEGVPEAAQLILLKLLQEDLLRRTNLLDQRPHDSVPGVRETADGESDGPAAERFQRLAAEQGELAKLVERMAAGVAGPAGKTSPQKTSPAPAPHLRKEP